MKNLKFSVPGNDTPGELQENIQWLNDGWINPLKELGFKFEKYGHVFDEDDEQGTHILKFKEDEDGHIMEDEEAYRKMQEICTQDDDSQPHATYRLYLGTLWVYIPYTT